jgi:hypothetical protein
VLNEVGLTRLRSIAQRAAFAHAAPAQVSLDRPGQAGA